MSTYVIGDIQGCFNELIALLKKINFNKHTDSLWFTGDLVNRGPHSYEVLSFIKNIPNKIIVLGNHDLHLLTTMFTNNPLYEKDTFQDILKHPDGISLCHFLRQQPFIHFDAKFNCILVHAGIPPMWNIKEVIKYNDMVQNLLSSDHYIELLNNLYGEIPNSWSVSLNIQEKTRMIINYFTRMRLCTPSGQLIFKKQTNNNKHHQQYLPWFKIPNKLPQDLKIFFGHWAALNGTTHNPKYIALDTGCVWGKTLTAYRLDDDSIFSVSSNYHFIEDLTN